MEKCANCGKEAKAMRAVGHWPRCQSNYENRAFDPHSQCIFKARHQGCHKAEYPAANAWFCS